jgi:hypothetical protein
VQPGDIVSIVGFAVDRIGFTADMIRYTGPCEQVALVGRVDEHLRLDPVSILELKRDDASRLLFHAGQAVLKVDRHLRFRQKGAQRGLRVGGAEPGPPAHAVEELGGQSADRLLAAEVHRGQARRREPAHVSPEDRQNRGFAHPARLHRRADATGRAAVDADVHLKRFRRGCTWNVVIVAKPGTRRARSSDQEREGGKQERSERGPAHGVR